MQYSIEHHQIFIQILGIIATCISLSGYMFKKDETAFRTLLLGKCFWILHFLLLGFHSAVVGAGIGFLKILLALKYKKSFPLFSILFITTIVLGIRTYTDLYSLLPIIGSCISVYSYFFYTGKKLRCFILLTSIFWIIFNIHVQSIGGILNEVIIQILTISTLYRLSKQKR